MVGGVQLMGMQAGRKSNRVKLIMVLGRIILLPCYERAIGKINWFDSVQLIPKMVNDLNHTTPGIQ